MKWSYLADYSMGAARGSEVHAHRTLVCYWATINTPPLVVVLNNRWCCVRSFHLQHTLSLPGRPLCLPFTQISDINVKSIGHSSTFKGTLHYATEQLLEHFGGWDCHNLHNSFVSLIRGLSRQLFQIWASRYTRRHSLATFVTNFVKIGQVVHAEKKSASKHPFPFERCLALS